MSFNSLVLLTISSYKLLSFSISNSFNTSKLDSISNFKSSILLTKSFNSFNSFNIDSDTSLSFQKFTSSVFLCSLSISSFFLGMSKSPP